MYFPKLSSALHFFLISKYLTYFTPISVAFTTNCSPYNSKSTFVLKMYLNLMILYYVNDIQTLL